MLTGPGIQNRCCYHTSRTTALLHQDHSLESLPTGPGIQYRCYHHISRTTALLHQNHSSESLSHTRLPMSANDRAFINSSCSFSDRYVISLLPLVLGSADTLLDHSLSQALVSFLTIPHPVSNWLVISLSFQLQICMQTILLWPLQVPLVTLPSCQATPCHPRPYPWLILYYDVHKTQPI